MDNELASAFAANAKEHSVKNNDQCLDYFDEWSVNYDKDVATMGYSPQRRATLMFIQHTKNMEVKEVLDVGAGVWRIFRRVVQFFVCALKKKCQLGKQSWFL